VLFNWLLVYIGNWGGCLLVAYFLGYLTNLFDYPQYRTYLNEVVLGKLEDLSTSHHRDIASHADPCFQIGDRSSSAPFPPTPWSAWLSFSACPPATPRARSWRCGFRSLCLSLAPSSTVLPTVSLRFHPSQPPWLTLWIVFFCSLGLMYGADSSIGRLWYNQSAAVLGNLVGGAIFIGLIEHLLNHWPTVVFRSHDPHSGTLLGHDIESTRRARDDYMHKEQDAPVVTVDSRDEYLRSSRESINGEIRRERKEEGQPKDAPASNGTAEQRSPVRQLLGLSGSRQKKDAADQV
jgi:formate transporter